MLSVNANAPCLTGEPKCTEWPAQVLLMMIFQDNISADNYSVCSEAAPCRSLTSAPLTAATAASAYITLHPCACSDIRPFKAFKM